MRLTCPNCAAQYEVPEDVIPAEGRDVQCSNCGQTWFQAAAGAPAAETADEISPDLQETAEAAHPPVEQAPEPEPAAVTEAETETGIAASAPPEDTEPPASSHQDETAEEEAEEPEPDDGTGAETQAETQSQPPRSRGLDPALTDILREEAEREASLRAAETGSLETQPDLGLEGAAPEDEAARRSRQARDRMARIRGEDPRQIAAAETGSRKELLPDIEEINSTLRSAGSAAPAPQAASEEPPVRRKSGFARGFALSLIAALALVMVYDNAALISEKVPQADSALSSYVGWVDQARLWLDGQVKSLTSPQ
ncbi:thioredoxin [Leisingera sp. ANG-M1]|uniref:zinc-ribbon domain-containing protein n=1 Tax=Leisingera sp. ANG-M1 TaxID=1577895 RepID=UPI00057EC54D|nr:zinc-ribbon domain-containing protein [Leisingera sp. ANG-M1]KIC11844.1 thioredoxin [Leisingera sp. ANG-M1]